MKRTAVFLSKHVKYLHLDVEAGIIFVIEKKEDEDGYVSYEKKVLDMDGVKLPLRNRGI